MIIVTIHFQMLDPVDFTSQSASKEISAIFCNAQQVQQCSASSNFYVTTINAQIETNNLIFYWKFIY